MFCEFVTYTARCCIVSKPLASWDSFPFVRVVVAPRNALTCVIRNYIVSEIQAQNGASHAPDSIFLVVRQVYWIS